MDQQTTDIGPPRISMNILTIWKSRQLLYFFVWRDIKVKYKQTYLGFTWVLIQPIVLMTLFYFIFSRSLHVETGMDYRIFVLSGLILWELFASGIRNSSQSLVENASMIRKIYFPRILIPLASLLASLVDFMITLLLLIILMLITSQRVSWSAALFFPAGLAIAFISSFGIGSLLGALNVKFRDFRYVIPFLLQGLFFGSQVVYSINELQDTFFKNILYLNPINGALELFRAGFYNDTYNGTGLTISFVVMIILFVTGVLYFKKTEAYFADLI